MLSYRLPACPYRKNQVLAGRRHLAVASQIQHRDTGDIDRIDRLNLKLSWSCTLFTIILYLMVQNSEQYQSIYLIVWWNVIVELTKRFLHFHKVAK